MLVKRIDPDLITFTSLLFLSIVQNVFCRPKGGRRGSSVAVFGGGGGRNSFMPSDKWGVLSTGTKVFVSVLCILILIFMLIGLYRAYVWCTKDSGRR